MDSTRKTIVVGLLLIATVCFSQTDNVNTVCGTGCDYSSMGSCEANTETVGATTIEVCEYQASSSPYNESVVTFNSTDTFDENSHRAIQGEPGTTVGTDNNNAAQNVFEITEDWFEAGREGAGLFGEEFDGFNARWLRFNGVNDVVAAGLEIFDVGRTNCFAIELNAGTSATVRNVITHNQGGTGPFLLRSSGGATECNLFNNSCENAADHCYEIIGSSSGTYDFRNNVGIASNDAFEGEANIDIENNNATSGTELSGTGTLTSQTDAVFTDASTGDLTPAAGGNLIDAGDGTVSGVTVDHDGTTRSATMEIGAYDGGAESGGGQPAPRRFRPSPRYYGLEDYLHKLIGLIKNI